jgi:hypothetical protein
METYARPRRIGMEPTGGCRMSVATIIPHAPHKNTQYLSYCLKLFLEECERQFVPQQQWPLRTGVPRYVGDAAAEFRAERIRNERNRRK